MFSFFPIKGFEIDLVFMYNDSYMKKLMVSIGDKPLVYPIVIGEDLIEGIDSLFDFGRYTKIVILRGNNVPEKWVKRLSSAIPFETKVLTIPASEKDKNINTVIDIWDRFQGLGLDRKSLVINLGGGVICDMGGFAAGTFLRGIDFLQIPTTVLAQVDASTGGKAGINFKGLKNYLGLFVHPIGVVIDVSVTETLPPRIYRQGFAEIIKYGLIADREFFEFVTSKRPEEFSRSEIVQMLSKANELKVGIVQNDQRDKGIRRLVNFGHTIGHAIESLSFEEKEPMLHGEAVSIGLFVETKISEFMKLISLEDAEFVYARLGNTGLPVRIGDLNINEIVNKIRLDKKVVKGVVNWTLLAGVGKAIYDKQVDDGIVRRALEEARK